MGKRKALKGDGGTLKNDRRAFNGSKEVLKGVKDALKGDEKMDGSCDHCPNIWYYF